MSRTVPHQRRRRPKSPTLWLLLSGLIGLGLLILAIYSLANINTLADQLAAFYAPAITAPEAATGLKSYGTPSPTIGQTPTNTPESYGTPTHPAITARYVYVHTRQTHGRLNLRSGPGLNYPVLIVLVEDTQLEWLDCQGRWAQVIYAQYSGWVYSYYTEVDLCKSQ